MAHILDNSSGHKSFAPLSHGQTVELAQHLHSEHNSLELKVEELCKALQRTDSNVSELREDLHKLSVVITTVKDEMADTNIVLEGTRADLERTATNVNTISVSVDMVKENVDALRDGQKHTNTNVKHVREDLTPTQATVKAIMELLEKKHGPEVKTLSDEITETKRVLQKLIADHTLTRSDLSHEIDKVRKMDESLAAAIEAGKQASRSLDEMEGKYLETKETLRTQKKLVEETNGVVVKIHEDHEKTKGSLLQCHDDLKSASTHIKKLDDGLDKTSKVLTKSQADLSKTSARVEQAHEVLGFTVDHVNSLREGHAMANASLASLERGLEGTHRIAHQTKNVLNETNSILLPNLHMESNGEPTSAAALGSAAGSGSPPKPKGSPGKARTPRTGTGSWTIRNLGTSPNRMAMI